MEQEASPLVTPSGSNRLDRAVRLESESAANDSHVVSQSAIAFLIAKIFAHQFFIRNNTIGTTHDMRQNAPRHAR